MLQCFAPPQLPPEQQAQATRPTRYEDVTQDGRLRFLSLPNLMGDVTWRNLLANHPAHDWMFESGVVPILSRMVLRTTPGPMPPAALVDVKGWYQLAHHRNENNQIEKLFMNMGATIFAPQGYSYKEAISPGTSRIEVGSVFAEHVFTRLFAPPDQRKVTSLDGAPMPAIPNDRYCFNPAENLLATNGITPFANTESTYHLDPVSIVFGLPHTDANQHVNSLVYPRLFEEATFRRAAALGVNITTLQTEACEIAFRKPSFVGETVMILLRLVTFVENGKTRLGAVGAFVDAGISSSDLIAGKGRPRCCIRLVLQANLLRASKNTNNSIQLIFATFLFYYIYRVGQIQHKASTNTQ